MPPTAHVCSGTPTAACRDALLNDKVLCLNSRLVVLLLALWTAEALADGVDFLALPTVDERVRRQWQLI